MTEAALQVFRRHDSKGLGTIDCDAFARVMKTLDVGLREDEVNRVLKASGFSADNALRYEDFLRWLAASSGAKSDPVCQAAFDGDADTLRKLLKEPDSSVAQEGFVAVGGALAGLWSPGLGSWQLKRLVEESKLQPASALHYAAFAGKAEVVNMLLENGADKEREGELGVPPCEIADNPRLMLDGSMVEDDGEAAALLQPESPLAPEILGRAATSGLSMAPERMERTASAKLNAVG